MSEADLFAKLNRILETHNLASENDNDADDFLERFSYDLSEGRDRRNKSETSEPASTSGRRPTPFEVWKSKQVDTGKKKASPKLSSEQWDGLVGHLHKTNKLKESSVMKEQNQGLAAEFSGHQFKPQMNPRSQELMSNKRESLHQRVSSIVLAHEAVLAKKRAAKAEKELAECSFKPQRVGESTSDKYLKKLGRQVNQSGSVDPEYFFKYHEEKLRRNAIRQQIVSEMTARELTFKPAQNAKSQAMQQKLKMAQSVAQKSMPATAVVTPDAKGRGATASTPSSARSPALSSRSNGNIPVTPIASASPQVPFSSLSKVSTQKILQQPHKLLAETGCGDPTAGDYFGAPIVVESCHPYKNNTQEYTTVNIQGALSYTVTFDENTRTEPIHDFVKFYADDTHTDYYGCGKYSGGMRVAGTSNYASSGTVTADAEHGKATASNWPGIGGRPALVIPAGRFVVCFRTNGTVTDWGFKMLVTPLISGASTAITRSGEAPHREGHPVISERGKLYRSNTSGTASEMSRDEGAPRGNVYSRLHKEAVTRTMEHHNRIAEQMQSKLNITMKPWEAKRQAGASNATWTLNKSHHAKRNTSNVDFSDMLIKRPNNAAARRTRSHDENSNAGDANVLSVANLQDEHSDGASEGTAASASVPYAVMDFDDSMGKLWRSLREAVPMAPSAAGEEGDADVAGAAADVSMPEL